MYYGHCFLKDFLIKRSRMKSFRIFNDRKLFENTITKVILNLLL